MMMNKMKVEETILNILNSPMDISWKKKELKQMMYDKIGDLQEMLENATYEGDVLYTDEMKKHIDNYTKQL